MVIRRKEDGAGALVAGDKDKAEAEAKVEAEAEADWVMSENSIKNLKSEKKPIIKHKDHERGLYTFSMEVQVI